MANTIDIRRRIRSVKNTQQITKAMKMVAAAKLRRAQERMFAARPYSAALRQVLTSVATRVESLEHPLLYAREEKRVLLVVVTADKGLAGAFNSNIAQRVIVERLLPIERAWDEVGTEVDYLYEPGPEQILSELLPKHIEFQLYRILLESAASEQGARMTAMEAATKNASDMIGHLTLTYNRIRQASITKEIIEIVSGAAAQEG